MPPEAVCELAAAHALGALAVNDEKDFAAHLEQGCEKCRAELSELQAVVDDLALAAPGVMLREDASERIFSRIAAAIALDQESIIEKDGLVFARGARLDWMTLPPGGIQVKALNVDTARGVTTQLVRMEAGATYPSHRHGGVEELYLLEGELSVSGVVMRSGDYCRAETGSLHTGINSPTGCLFISSSSAYDEPLL